MLRMNGKGVKDVLHGKLYFYDNIYETERTADVIVTTDRHDTINQILFRYYDDFESFRRYSESMLFLTNYNLIGESNHLYKLHGAIVRGEMVDQIGKQYNNSVEDLLDRAIWFDTDKFEEYCSTL